MQRHVTGPIRRPSRRFSTGGRRARAVFLIELFIAIAVLTIAVTALVALLPATSRMDAAANEQETACAAAREQLALCRARGFASLAASDGRAFDVPGLALPPGARSCGTLSVDLAPFEGERIARVTATVRWHSSVGADNRFSMEGLIGE